MPLLKTISGMRGTIGGKPLESLTPVDIVQYIAAYGSWLTAQQTPGQAISVVVGRDARISGTWVANIVNSVFISMGIHVIDVGLSTTPSTALAVIDHHAQGGIIISASHNTKEWNALKMLTHLGEMIDSEVANTIALLAEKAEFVFADTEKLGTITIADSLKPHIAAILKHPLVNVAAIKKAKMTVVVDAINSVGALAIPPLLKALGVHQSVILNEELTGRFAHNPEPLPEHLTQLCGEVIKQNADLGIAVDPDVDRLCFVCEDGSFFGEEYTLVAIADYYLQHKKGPVVNNLSSTQALQAIAAKHQVPYYSSAVGEINVVNKMKQENAVIGGEGNGGIIIPELHYGRDALIGIALFLTQLAQYKQGAKKLRNTYPNYFLVKNKIGLEPNTDITTVFQNMAALYKNQRLETLDGLKIYFDQDWVHLRSSNTESIIRIYAESNFETTAKNIATRLVQNIKEMMQTTK